MKKRLFVHIVEQICVKLRKGKAMNEKEILEQLKEINKKLDKKKSCDNSDIWFMIIFAALFVTFLVDKVLSVVYG